MFPTSELTFNVIVRKYFDKGNTKEVNYFQFCADVDKPEDMFPGYAPKQRVINATFEEQKQATMKGTFYEGSTKAINVTESRFS